MLRAVLQCLVGGWNFWDQLFLFGGLFLILIVLIPFMFPKLRIWFQGNTVEFYFTRKEKNDARGDLINELKPMKKVWAAWWTGRSPNASMVFDKNTIKRQPSVNRIILFDPNGTYIKSHGRISGQTEKESVDEIKATANHAINSGTEVHYFDGFIEGIIIADPEEEGNQFSDKSWARIETAIPFRNSDVCFNFVIYKKQNKDVFNALLDHYDLLWSNKQLK
jgi:hypothetical protein